MLASRFAEPTGEQLLGRSRRRPYYIVAPRFDHRSAGIVTLHALCHALNLLGEEAYIWRTTPGPMTSAGLLNAPILDECRARTHFAEGRPPVFVTPETYEGLIPGGLHVAYLLNYPGVVGGASSAPESCDLILAYSAKIAAAVDGCSEVLFIPTSDPNIWTPPDVGTMRSGQSAYLGKWATLYGRGLPPGLKIDRIITRDTPHHELRPILRTSQVLHIFENTALTAEALLCGCPVVCHYNDRFAEQIAEEEVGLDGVIEGDLTEAALAHAYSTVGRFRERYSASIDALPGAFARFIDLTQTAPIRRAPSAPPIPPILSGEAGMRAFGERLIRWRASLAEGGLLRTIRLAVRRRLADRRSPPSS